MADDDGLTAQDKALESLMYEISATERKELLEWIAGLNIPSALQKTLARGCDLDKAMEAYCPNCDTRVTIRYPDWKGMKGFVELLFQYKLQKPADLRQIDINVRAIKAREELEELTDAELVAISEGEWKPLPPAA